MSENLWFCDVFRGYRKGKIRLKRVKFEMKGMRTWSSGLIGRWITNPDKQHRDLLPFEKWSVIESFWLTIDFLKMTLITERLALNCLSWTWIYCCRIRNYWPQIGKKYWKWKCRLGNAIALNLLTNQFSFLWVNFFM